MSLFSRTVFGGHKCIQVLGHRLPCLVSPLYLILLKCTPDSSPVICTGSEGSRETSGRRKAPEGSLGCNGLLGVFGAEPIVLQC